MYATTRLLRATLRAFVVCATLVTCKGDPKRIEPDSAFIPYIPAFTYGHISARAAILVRLAEDRPWKDTSVAAIQDLFDLHPEVDGAVEWLDHNTLAFRPTERLKSDQTYEVVFRLGDIMEVPKGMEEFRFQVSTIRQSLDVRITDMQALSSTDLTWQRVLASVYTSDDATGQDVEGCIRVTQGKRHLSLTWEHEANGQFHRFSVDSVLRGEQPDSVLITWNGEKIESDIDSALYFRVPAIGDLVLVSSSTTSAEEQFATLLFSDPLDPAQDLAGLAGISGQENVRPAIDGNKLLLYPEARLSGEHQAFVAEGLANVNHRTLGKDITVDLTFEDIKPAISLVGKGTILPSTDGLLFPFDAVNLSAVEVRVIRIYEENVAQFLQVNNIDGEYELARVGRQVLHRIIPLQGKEAPKVGRWNRHYLDLADLIKTEPGAIYRIELDFRREHSIYPCPNDKDKPRQIISAPQDIDDGDGGQWDEGSDHYYYDDYEEEYYYEDEEYDWRKREDPCSGSYYTQHHSVSRNILASDLGLIAKRGNDGSMLVAVSDLKSTAPMSGVKVDVLDKQRRSLAQLVTDGEGLVTLPKTKHKGFLLVASKDSQRGYLKLDDGNSLSLSEYEVEGEYVERGLKGFIYGERGVWRPGDSLYLSFMLQDPRKTLPKDHPVTLEITDARGRLDQKHVRTSSVNGLYSFRCATSPDAPTGFWHARVNVGGTSFHHTLRIETIKPNRLKVNIDLPERITSISRKKEQVLTGNWLHGAPAKNLKARTTVTMTRGWADFKGYDKYNFDDLYTGVNTDERVVFDGQLDATGKATFPMDISFNGRAPAAVNANFVTRIFEAGGDASTDNQRAVYLPYSSYAGVHGPDPRNAWGTLRTDTNYTFSAVAIDPDGKPLAGHALKVSVYKMERDWWWDGGYDEAASYVTSPSIRLESTQDIVTDSKGKATANVRVDRPKWGRFIVRVYDPASGHACASNVYFDWPGYEGRSRRGDAEQAAMLNFNSDKEKYHTGDEAEIVIPSSGTGRALVSLETGSRILDAQWVELKAKETRYKFNVTADMAPNIFVHVTLVQPHANTINDLPIRLYGVIPILVEDPATHIAPVLETPKEIRTDVPFSVSVKEKEGLPMTYTLAIVDEGLLDLTRFKTPDPWEAFYAREALGVRTWDMYDQVIGAFGRQLERILALGGSDDAGPVDPSRVNRFKPVVRFVGPFTIGKNGNAKHSFTISNYVGSVRVMVVATDGARAYGSTEKAVPVKKPLMLLATLPRVVGPGETVDLPVTVFAMDKKIKDVQLRLEANKLFTLQGPDKIQLKFTEEGDQVAVFKVRMAETIGTGKVKLIAEGAGEKAAESIEIAVRQPNQPQTFSEEVIIEPGQSWQATPNPVGLLGTNSAYLELSTIPPIDFGRRLKYLMDYPHGCVEQTTSKAFPQLYIADVTEVDAKSAQYMRSNVEAAIRKLREFQNADGGFTYWPGSTYVDDWCSVYVGHFLTEAERKGFNIPAAMKSRWLSNQRSVARNWNFSERDGWTRHHSQLTQAYRLYVLATANASELAPMNRMRTMTGLSDQAKWMLAAAYAVTNNREVAQQLIAGVSPRVSPYTELSWTYGSDLRDEAMIAEALLKMNDKAKAAGLIQDIAKRLGSESWYSTQSTAFGLMAVARLAEGGELGKGMSFALTQNGTPKDRFSEKAIVRTELAVPDGKATVGVKNSGKNLLYLRMVRTGTPLAGDEQAESSGLSMFVTFETANGTAISIDKLEQGTDFVASVTITNPSLKGYNELALTQVFPSGWEIRNTRLEGSGSAVQASYYDYQDVRDDRVLTYFDLWRGGSVTYKVMLNASYAGRFYLPGTVCEAMYDNTINARSQGKWITVVRPGEDAEVSR